MFKMYEISLQVNEVFGTMFCTLLGKGSYCTFMDFSLFFN